jgi:hypothetical protein
MGISRTKPVDWSRGQPSFTVQVVDRRRGKYPAFTVYSRNLRSAQAVARELCRLIDAEDTAVSRNSSDDSTLMRGN